ncbi:MAG: RNA polymerase sigma factor, partial [Bacteroidota bacterium]
FRGDSRLSTWLYRIMVAKSLNWIRNTKRKKRFGVILPIFGIEAVETSLVSTENLPEEELERTERAEVLTQALERLPLNQRTAFTMHKINDISYDEIAEVMGVSHSAVESLIHRAKEHLRKILSDYYKDR